MQMWVWVWMQGLCGCVRGKGVGVGGCDVGNLARVHTYAHTHIHTRTLTHIHTYVQVLCQLAKTLITRSVTLPFCDPGVPIKALEQHPRLLGRGILVWRNEDRAYVRLPEVCGWGGVRMCLYVYVWGGLVLWYGYVVRKVRGT